MLRGAGCRELNPRLRRREKNILDIPFYRPGHYAQNAPAWRRFRLSMSQKANEDDAS